ncbi:hypothetical protein [Xanthocytophaga flava]|nr:hypothetical protein [Xanthocytophaga flavus]MDJ1469026.1 hypothetical protein [Xanthocytophaga flavus]
MSSRNVDLNGIGNGLDDTKLTYLKKRTYLLVCELLKIQALTTQIIP